MPITRPVLVILLNLAKPAEIVLLLCNRQVNGKHIFPILQLEPLLVHNSWLLSLYAIAVADAIFGNPPS